MRYTSTPCSSTDNLLLLCPPRRLSLFVLLKEPFWCSLCRCCCTASFFRPCSQRPCCVRYMHRYQVQDHCDCVALCTCVFRAPSSILSLARLRLCAVGWVDTCCLAVCAAPQAAACAHAVYCVPGHQSSVLHAFWRRVAQRPKASQRARQRR